jgi:putative radical SAM enzyme (TIGR03279 family)
MAKEGHIIKKIVRGSIAEELGIEVGDVLLAMDDSPVEDIFDYQYHMEAEYLEVTIRKKDTNEEWLLEIEKDEDEDLGIVFDSGLMDDYRSCRNQCMFCFIDQMPPGMRSTLYFKDDDSRLSFLQGNYVTLTNMSDHDIDRIIAYHLSPINISFHTTNPELRTVMLKNRFAGDIFPKVKRLAEAGVRLNGQIVLCRHVNDQKELDRTIGDLEEYLPSLESVSIVPVGLTKFRQGLYPLEPFDKESARELLKQVHRWQNYYLERHGTRLVQPSDEWYLLAEEPVPDEETYEDYPQLGNGVGMLRLLEREFSRALSELPGDDRFLRMTIATGYLAADWIGMLLARMREKFPNVDARLRPIRNDFFGPMITVSGLITGQDLIAQLSGLDIGEKLLIPNSMLRAGESVFLDDTTVEDVERALGVPVVVVGTSGESLLNAVLGGDGRTSKDRRMIYEQTDCSDCGEAERRKIDAV